MRERGVVTAPDGTRWRVRRRWLERPARTPRPRLRLPRRPTLEDGLDAASMLPDPGGFADAADDPLTALALVLGAVLLGLLAAFVLLPLLGVALELAVPLVLAGAGLLGRVLLGRPWTIEAVAVGAPAQRVAFAVPGWRRSRRALAALTAAIETTGPPSALPEADPARSPT